MSHNKRYYWLKLMKDFFQQAKIKKLRRIAGGDTYVVIYLKMMLLSINSKGVIIFESIEPTFEEELALTLDEEVKNVEVLVAYLKANSLIEQKSDTDFFMVEVSNLIGTETSSAERVRKHREKKKMLHCNTTVTDVKQLETKCNTEKRREEIEIEYIEREEANSSNEIQQMLNSFKNSLDIDIFLNSYIDTLPNITNRDGFIHHLRTQIKNQDRSTLENLLSHYQMKETQKLQGANNV